MFDHERPRSELISEIELLRRRIRELKDRGTYAGGSEADSENTLESVPNFEEMMAQGLGSPHLPSFEHYDSTDRRDIDFRDDGDTTRPNLLRSDSVILSSLSEVIVAELEKFSYVSDDTEGLTTLLDAVPLPIVLTDDSFRITFANPAVQNVDPRFSATSQFTLSNMFPVGEELETVEQLVIRALRNQSTQVHEGFFRLNGPLTWIQISIQPIRMDGTARALISIEGLQPEKQVFGTRKYKKLVKIFPEAIGEFALSTPITYSMPDDEVLSSIMSARLVDANEQFAVMHGHKDTETVIGTSLKELSPLVQRNQRIYLHWVRKFFPTGSFEVKEKGPDDTLRYVELTLIGELDRNRIVSFWELRNDITTRKVSEKKLKKSLDVLKKTLYGTVDAISSIAEKRDPYTAGHQKQTAKLAQAVAEQLGLTEDHCSGIHVAASIHDIGKIYVPAEFLSKPGSISRAEKDIIKQHPQVGYDILKEIKFPWPIADIVLQHHERLDGSGYPQSLKGDDILLESRIVSVADVVEAMSSHRPYRPALGLDTALSEIRKNKGILYDAQVVDACLAVLDGGFSFH
jgi:putative nucleotidyltransferase with HDIG domain